MPNISVIVPVYKVENYLSRCIDSILAQTYQDFELILVDDGSPDNCGKICDEYAEKESRIHVIHKENGGLSDARNAGLDWVFENSNSEWISFVDSDDYIPNNSLGLLLGNAIEYNSDLVFGIFQRFDDEKFSCVISNNSVLNLSQTDYWKALYCVSDNVEFEDNSCSVVAWGKLYRKELFKSARFPKGRVHEDEAILHEIIDGCKQISYISTVLYYYYQRGDSIMSTLDSKSIVDTSYAFFKRFMYFKSKKEMQEIISHAANNYLNYMLYAYIAIYYNGDKGYLYALKIIKKYYRVIFRYMIFHGLKIATVKPYRKIDYYTFYLSFRLFDLVILLNNKLKTNNHLNNY